MSVNRTQNSLDMRLFRDVANLKRELAQLKTPQANGADVIEVNIGSTATAGPFTITAGQGHIFVVNVDSSLKIPTLWDFPFSLYIDALDDAHKLPDGSSLTSTFYKFPYGWNYDLQDSDLTNNGPVVKIWILNNDSSDHTCYVKITSIRPKGTS